jgi:hypothetical protein
MVGIPNKRRCSNMFVKHKLAGAAAVLVALAGFGTATAMAQTSTTPKPTVSAPAPEPVAGPDTDTVQSGDQTTPDVAGAAGKEATTPESANGTETGAPSDGPGGHEDPPGNVDNQQQGEF